MPSSAATGPLTISTGEQGWVVDCTANRLKAGSSTASTAVSTTGKYSGAQPAITALMARTSTVATPWRGGMSPSSSAGDRSVQDSIRSTRAAVGATTGRPSD